MKQANALLFLIVGLPVGAFIWIAMVGPEAGVTTIILAAVSVGVVLQMKNRKET